MDFVTWLDSKTGRSKALAARCHVSQAAVSQWRKVGVPMIHWPEVVAFAGRELSVQNLVDHSVTVKRSRAAGRAANEHAAA
jgi:hypothetical protein